MTIGHIMLDLEGTSLSQLEKELIAHPQVGGIILFARNYETKKQLQQLTKAIRKCSPQCLIAVDQEGGRIQRFKNDFTLLPPFKEYGHLFQKNPEHALSYTRKMASLMAQELKGIGIDISFSPVLDLDNGLSQVIGDRSFHHQAEVVTALGRAFINGMHDANMPATGKHFPGHGAVVGDSHLTLPVDSRSYETVFMRDMQPFLALKQELDAVMPAHILYQHIDTKPVCFSAFWLQDVLREKIKFEGVIFSDDLSMAGAECMGDYLERSHEALTAGCDMILICNHREEAIKVLDEFERYQNPASLKRLSNFRNY